MDAAGSASIRGSIIHALGRFHSSCLPRLCTFRCRILSIFGKWRVVLLFAFLALPALAQPPRPSITDLEPRIQQLAAEQNWPEIVRQLDSVTDKNADLNYSYGSALAQVGRLDDAQRAFEAGMRLAPRDKRFPVELAGVAFKQKSYPAATRWLRRGLRIDPSDSYANDFLATVYFLEGNLEAALKYWNAIGKPYIETVHPDHPLRIRPALLDRSLAFSAASELRLADLETSKVRLEGLGIFPAPRVLLIARTDGKVDALLNLQERNRWGNNIWEGVLSMLSGVAYQTLYPEYNNINGSAINVESLARWDAEKRRLAMSLSSPLRQNPKWRYRVGVDLRNENWDIRESFTGPAPVLGALNLRREAGTADIISFNSGRWDWSAGVELSHRDYRSVVPGTSLTPRLLLSGTQLKQTAGLHYVLLRVPEHRLEVDADAASQLGRIWSQPTHGFGKLQGGLAVRWSPRAEGDDYAIASRLRAGRGFGQLPFDELFMLGMERDNDLWLRAHIGTRDGRKGSAPLGRSYFLSNNEIDKNVYSNGLITVKLSPFVDSGKITDNSDNLGSPKWLCDTGAQARLRVLGVGLNFVYGKDLRTGNNAYYFTAGR